ncbi:MAG TPA: cytochrome-c peroxidase, partial [Chitinophaga sp.]|nr:cytochrome-c peroxidase [Chitinophaga sp.]
MRKLLLIAVTAAMACWIGCRDNRREDTFDKDIHEWLFATVDSLEKCADSLLTASKGIGTAAEVQRIFTRCRKQYKRLEWFSEYYAPATSRSLNGPPLPEIEIEENKKADPAGLQVIEELLYPYDTANVRLLDKEVRTFISTLIPLRHTVENTRFDTAHVFDACKQELTRIISLGITGFDTPLCGEGITEAAVSLQGIKEIWGMMAVPAEVLNKTDSAMAVCRKKEDFDYAGFIVRHINPLSVELTNWFNREGLTQLKYPGALNYSAATMFDSAAFNAGFFIHAAELEPTPEKVALGKALFSNEQLAGNGKRSCGSCHQQDKAFTDGLARNTALNGEGEVARNTPTLLYAGLQQSQFYDMRSPTLENQVMDVLHNTNEMHSSPEAVAAWLNRTPGMKDTFRRVFQG